MERININVSAVDYDKTSTRLKSALGRMEEMIHGEEEFVMTDSEFAFGWHFFVVSVRKDAVQRLSEQMGDDFQRQRGKGIEKKFLTWLADKMGSDAPRFKLAIKEEMESSKYGVF